MIKRKSDLRSIVTDIESSGLSNASASIMQNIRSNFNNFITSEWAPLTSIFTSPNAHYGATQKSPIPSAPDTTEQGHITVHADELIKFLALPFVKVSQTNVPDNSVIAFGSRFYSNDEQKAFALKHDMSIAKSPAKTQYYILSPDEDGALARVASNKGDSAIKNKKLSCIVATSHAVVDSVNQAFNNDFAYRELAGLLTGTKGISPESLDKNFSMNQESGLSETDHTPIQAIVEAFKYSWLGSAYQSPYRGLQVKEVVGRGRVLETRHFYFDWAWNNRNYRGLNFYGKVSKEFSDITRLFIETVTPQQIEDFKAGKRLPVNLITHPSFELRWQTKPGNQYYGNNYRFGSEYIHNPAIKMPPIYIDPSATDHYEIIQSNDYYSLENNYVILDRLVGFLSENPSIQVVSSSVFRRQITESNPTLNIATYDSLYGMFRSDDANTQKTAAKMLQSFDLPAYDAATRGSTTYYRAKNLAPNPAQYALELAIDLLINSEVTGASLDKWFVKNLGTNLSRARRSYARNGRYGNNPYSWQGSRYGFSWIEANDPPDTMPYADRSKYHDLTNQISEKLLTYLKSDVDSLSKYWNMDMLLQSTCNNKELANYCETYRDLTARRDTLDSKEQSKLGYLELFMRHYVEYTFARYYLGGHIHIAYDLEITSPADLNIKVDDAFINAKFGTFRSKYRAAKAKALANPTKYIEILTKNETAYRTKYIHSLSGYRSENIADYAQQSFLRDFPLNYLVANDSESTVNEIVDVFNYYLANL
jgi:hypothetical protein